MEFFNNEAIRTYNAKVRSAKATVYSIKKENFIKILKDNRDILQYLTEKWESKRNFWEQRLGKYLNMRYQSWERSTMNNTFQPKSGSYDKYDHIVNHNIKIQRNLPQVNIRELFLLTKEVGNYQLALTHYKNGSKMMDLNENDEIKVRNLVHHKLGIKQP